jgi:spore germination protein GerM
MKKTFLILVACFFIGLLGAVIFNYFRPEPEPVVPEKLPEEEVVVFFLNSSRYQLEEVKRVVPETEHITGRIEQIIAELKEEPGKKNLQSLLPSDLELRSVFLEEDVVYLDFNEALIGAAEGSSGEMMFLYSIVNSLIANIPEDYKLVKFLVNGEMVKTIGPYGEESGHISIEYPLGPRWNLVGSQ